MLLIILNLIFVNVIFRYILMHKFGGLYVDLDFYCLRPIDYLLEQVKFESINKTQKTQENNIILNSHFMA